MVVSVRPRSHPLSPFLVGQLYEYPRFETALLFLFCYLCYSLAESMELSGIMALFFNGILLSHYNSYNLSETSFVTAEQVRKHSNYFV